ncbi:hypothetical protein ACFQ3N_00120 [Virgibacillus byunsanensis]|uniref:Uncharacterized protein n=1 Tax=Virgibacillus byunsanensis TaxID=570945 RepID=A0ABW3LGL4_9BACI
MKQFYLLVGITSLTILISLSSGTAIAEPVLLLNIDPGLGGVD